MNFQKHTIRVYNKDKLEYLLAPYSNCVLCFDYPIKPIMTLCGHVYCYDCVVELLEHKKFCICDALLYRYFDIKILIQNTAPKNESLDVKETRDFQPSKVINTLNENHVRRANDRTRDYVNSEFETCIMRYGSFECDFLANLSINPIAARYQIDEEYFIKHLGTECYAKIEQQDLKKGSKIFTNQQPNSVASKDEIADCQYEGSLSNFIKAEKDAPSSHDVSAIKNQTFSDKTKETQKTTDFFRHNDFVKNEATLRAINKTKNLKLQNALFKTVSYQKINGESIFMSKKSLEDLRKRYSYDRLPEYIEIVILHKKEVIYTKKDKYFEDGFLQHLCEGRAVTICDVCFDI